MAKTSILPVLTMLALAACQQSVEWPTEEQLAEAMPPPPLASSQPRPRASTPAPSSPPRSWNMTRFRCDEMMGLRSEDRAAAAMFFYGYVAADARLVTIDASGIGAMVRRVMDRCARMPDATVVDTFRQELRSIAQNRS